MPLLWVEKQSPPSPHLWGSLCPGHLLGLAPGASQACWAREDPHPQRCPNLSRPPASFQRTFLEVVLLLLGPKMMAETMNRTRH